VLPLIGVGAAVIVATLLFVRHASAMPQPTGTDGARVAIAREMARKAGVPLSVYALARVGQSEASAKQGTVGRIAKMWVAMNDALAHNRKDENGKPDIFWISTHSKNPARNGLFGKQAGKRYSTANEPTKDTLQLAASVYYGKTANPVGKAVKFIDPAAMKSQEGVTKTFAQVDAEWQKEGKRPFSIASVPGTIFYA
jgi:hypothetical protein